VLDQYEERYEIQAESDGRHMDGHHQKKYCKRRHEQCLEDAGIDETPVFRILQTVEEIYAAYRQRYVEHKINQHISSLPLCCYSSSSRFSRNSVLTSLYDLSSGKKYQSPSSPRSSTPSSVSRSTFCAASW